MATPPPEGTTVLKEDKTQLPPAVTDVSLDSKTTGSQDTVSEIKAAAQEQASDKLTETTTVKADKDTPPAVNGHGSEQPTLTNGVSNTVKDEVATPSSPKSPALNGTTDSNDVSAPSKTDSELKPAESSESKPEQASTTAVATDAPSASSVPENASENAPSENKMEAATEAKQPSAAPSDLPHHPSPSKPASAAPEAPAQQPQDQEMVDAPLSPTKVARERDADGSEEPAAKRTKTNGDGPGFKVPELPPTPAAETPVGHAADGQSGITKMQHKFLLKAVQNLKRSNDARWFKEPVDPIKMNIPHYPNIITQPMDLSTIERKLKQNEYKNPEAVLDDVRLMAQNATKFNGPDHIVAQEGQRLQASFEKSMGNLPKPDEVEEKKPKKAAVPTPKTQAARRESRVTAPAPAPPKPAASSPQATTFALGPEGLPLIRRDSTNADGRPKRSIHPPKRDLPYTTKPKKKKYQWELKFCQEVLDELHKQKYYNIAAPFYFPVDPVALNIPTYHNIIKRPMDLSTVAAKLKAGQYENAKEFELDVRQMFKNCFKFNIPGDPTYIAGQKLEEVFDAKWAQKARWLEAHEPHPEHQSVSSEDEESDEDVEDSDDEADDEKLQLLRRQIAEMSRQVEAITQKKKKTPPAGKKSGKSKNGKKDSKKSGGGGGSGLAKKDKKGSAKASKPEKQRWVTYQEKQIISNGISSLPDKKMQEALRIIQNNVPSLKGTQETEIELDIDELPNDVLVMLLKFVKKNAPHVMEDEEVVSHAPVPSAAPPKPKKNKPMSKYEQEAQINMLESNLSRFQGGGVRSPEPMQSVEANVESSDEDDDSEESEEE
ncbi:transcription initiation at TATA-containing promoter protein [Paecilomyces lecythidis]|uniref:Transcription initiation at TATA-containing promoter protein n=1 Tax=Paecilomyces lecythidis TaxID=3004212 RepID=A0ABR3WMT7_9EURO